MAVTVHPTAIVERGAELARDVSIGPYAYVGPNVRLGEGCRVHHHATIDGYTALGEGCEVFPQAVLGTQPQDIKFRGERTTLEIGKHNVFREMVTVHPGTANGLGYTRIGDHNLLLVGVHVAHDCTIENRCIIANYVQFAGHVYVESNVNMGGNSAVHHFVTVGRHAFIGGMTRVAADVPPYMVVVAARGSRSEIRMVNGVGLQRSGFSNEDIGALKSAFMQLYSRRARQSPQPIRDRVQALLDAPDANPHVRYLCEFLLRGFDMGRHGRYLESLRNDPVHRRSWRLEEDRRVTVDVVGRGSVQQRSAPPQDRGLKVVELTAHAEPGWTFTGWNGNLSGAGNPASVVLDGHKRITATFARQG
ncbi:MAG: acyl-ACP--UDP-N-acetylglucosamine O-acyltransferase [Planctomycetes bacterium]|nr:acyl-ACP--UDP-N-acetylglucosamine O-acyltransferase [Planctomycetota bacterium]